jgi:O-antigen/teichoic acid export membrane protein
VGAADEHRLAAGHGPARNTFYSLAGQVMGAAFSAVLTLFLIRALGPTDFGVLALAVSIGTLVLLVSDFGISTSAARFIAEDPRNRNHAAAVLRTAFGLKVLASAISTLILVLLAPTIADALDTPDLALPIRLVAIATAVQGFGTLFLSLFTALGRISLGLRYTLVESSVEASTSICLVLLGAGAAGAVAGRAIGFATAGILVAAVTVRLIGWPAIRASRGKGFPARRIVGYGVALVVIDGAFVIFDRADVLIIGAILGSTSAGIFDAATKLLALLKYPALAIAAGFTPRLAGSERAPEDVGRFLGALRAANLFYLFLAAPILVWADPIVHLLLGSDYAGSVDVLRASTPTVVLSGLSPILAAAANYLGEARRRVPLALGALGLNVAIDLVLVPRIGIVAGAIGTAAAFVVYTGGHVRICQRALEQSFAPLLPTVARGLAGAVAVGLLLFALGTEELGVLPWIVGVVVSPVLYLGILVGSRELSLPELRSAGGVFRAKVRGFRHG